MPTWHEWHELQTKAAWRGRQLEHRLAMETAWHRRWLLRQELRFMRWVHELARRGKYIDD